MLNLTVLKGVKSLQKGTLWGRSKLGIGLTRTNAITFITFIGQMKEKGWICLDGDLSDPISCLVEDGGRYFLSKGGGDDYEGGNYDKN